MPSKYAKDREALNINRNSASPVPQSGSKYAKDRAALKSSPTPQPTPQLGEGEYINNEGLIVPPSPIKVPQEVPFSQKPKLQQIAEALFKGKPQQDKIRSGTAQVVNQVTKSLDAPMNAYRSLVKSGQELDTGNFIQNLKNIPKEIEAYKKGFTGEIQTPVRSVLPKPYQDFANAHPKIGTVTDVLADIGTNPTTWTGVGLGETASKALLKKAPSIIEKSAIKATEKAATKNIPLNTTQQIQPSRHYVKAMSVDSPVNLPKEKKTPTVPLADQKENKFARTVVESETTLPEVKKPLEANMPTYKPITNENTLKKAQSVIDADIDEATRIVKSNQPATSESNAMAQLLMQKAQQEGRYQDAIDIVEVTSKKATDAGQAIQALSMWSRLTPEGMLKYAQRTIDTAKNGLNKNKFKDIKLTPDDAKHITDEMNKIKDMAEGRDKTVETAKVLDFIASKVPPTAMQKINTLQTMAQLLNPKTAIRNIGGNAVFAGAENVSNTLAAGIDKAASLFTGKRTTTLPGLVTQAKGFGKGFKLGLEDAIKGIDTSSMKTQFDLPQTTFRKGPLATLEKAMNIELKATDRGFYQAAYDDSLRQQMKAAKVSEPTKEMLDNAHFDGLYRTFQDDNIASRAFSGLKRSLNGGKQWGLGDVLIKYPKTPANLLMRGIDYSPIGVVKSLFEIGKGQRAFVNSLSRGIVGTSILGAGIALYDLGIITGKRNKDKDVDSLQRTTGGGGYKLNLSALRRYLSSGFDKSQAKTQQGDNIINYDWIQPLSIPFAAGANIGENKKATKTGDILGAVVASLEGGASTLAEQPLVQGISKAFQGYDPVQSMIESVIGVPASFVPTALNQVRQYTDNTSRNVDSENILQKSMNMVKNKIPVLSKELPERVNTLGQTQQIYQNNSLGNVFLNPSFSSKYDAKPEAQLPLGIFERTGSKEQFPRVAAKSVTEMGQKIEFNPSEQAQFQKYIGEFTSEQFRRLYSDPNFMTLPDEIKVEEMKRILDDSTEQAKYRMLQNKGIIK